MPRGKFIAIYAYIRKKERSQINNLSSHLKKVEKKNKTQKKQKEENNISAEIHKIGGKYRISMKQKVVSLKRSNWLTYSKIDKKNRRQELQISGIKQDIAIDVQIWKANKRRLWTMLHM